MFVVPTEHLHDFGKYLKSLGIVDEAMHKDYNPPRAELDDAMMGKPHEDRDPPITQKLLFTNAGIIKGGAN